MEKCPNCGRCSSCGHVPTPHYNPWYPKYPWLNGQVYWQQSNGLQSSQQTAQSLQSFN